MASRAVTRTEFSAFPWSNLVRAKVTDVSGAPRMMGLLSHLLDASLLAAHMSARTKQAVSFTLRKTGTLHEYSPASSEVAASFALAGDDDLGAVVVACESALAVRYVAAALNLAAPGMVDPRALPNETLLGAFAACTADGIRHASPKPWRPRAAAPARELWLSLRTTDPAAMFAAISVIVGSEVYGSTLAIPSRMLARFGALHLSSAKIANYPLLVPVVLASCVLTREAFDALAAGDVVQTEGTLPLAAGSPNAPASNSFECKGIIHLCPGHSETAIAVTAQGARGQVDSARQVPMPWSVPEDLLLSLRAEYLQSNRETSMDDSQWLAASPVVVRVELGAIELRAAEWAALTEGTVLSLGRSPDEGVTLRAGGIVVARGQLVLVEGKVGVQITERVG